MLYEGETTDRLNSRWVRIFDIYEGFYYEGYHTGRKFHGKGIKKTQQQVEAGMWKKGEY